jgi:DNA primase
MQFFDLNSYMADMVYELVPGVRRQGHNQLNFRCPICGDGKKKTSRRGHFYMNEGSYYCWNAGCPAYEHGMSGLQFLSALTGKTHAELKKELIKRANTFTPRLKPTEESQDKSVEVYRKKLQKKPSTINSLFDDEEPVSEFSELRNNLEENKWTVLPEWVQAEVDARKIFSSKLLPKDWELFYDKITDRLVIPWTDEYYQLRALTKQQEYESGKYLFPPEQTKPIFGLNNIDPNFKYIFLLEGVFDAIFVKNGCAVGSLKLSNFQNQLLEHYKKDYTIVYFMDNQYKDKSSYDATLKLAKESPWINLFIWPEQFKAFKDVNDSVIFHDDFLKVWTNENFLKSRIFNGVVARLQLK